MADKDAAPAAVSALAVTFEPMTAEAAECLGSAFAQIDPWAHYAYTAATLAGFLADEEPGTQRFQIIAEQALAGAIVIQSKWLRGPYLQFLGVLPAFHRRGLGRSALGWFESAARADGARNLWVAASEFNVAAQTFYERHGFVRIASIDGLVAEGTAEILFRKQLAAG
ncbi:GNAT family N-acetyltransferase [Hyphomicrobium sp.]|uniref:GNAT family N-acetyltransferase n=1 Tax=Hyphomicrobium sp. TaxID=82 RepID=UPI000F9495EB|nr:GNAT family N-acetyltransferase [Hyphomicrobium sp.]RUP10973.1 MAG: GNAT family N-acetyltransferase [Hyphomicrobium sp.]